MSTKDVIKKSVLEGFATDVSVAKIIITLGITAILACYVFYIYRMNSKSSFYSREFNKTLAIMPVITAAIVLAMQSSIVISLGMVGALSIVRFRNAVKNSMDLLFLFWSIGIGIICGAGLYLVAIITCLAVTLLSFLLDFTKLPQAPCLLVVNSTDREIEDRLRPILEQFAKGYKIKSRNVTSRGIDFVIELRTKQEKELLKECSNLSGVGNLSLMSHDGETRY